MKILVTGARGMIGSVLVQKLLDEGYAVVGVGRSGEDCEKGNYRFVKADLADRERLREIVEENGVDRIIHLAALAHSDHQKDLSWERYRRENVDCAENVFACAGERPLLYISTIDVYGFYDGKEPVNSRTPVHPVSKYGRSKAMAEQACQRLPHYTIFRLSPVYTPNRKRDIQKRYYLKYPRLAYQVGKGSAFEVLNVDLAAAAMAAWCGEEPKNDIRILKDARLLWTPGTLQAEKDAGRANIVLHVPRCCVDAGYTVLKAVFGENEKTYLLNKLVHPLRTE